MLLDAGYLFPVALRFPPAPRQPMAPLASLRAKGFSGAMASQRNSKDAEFKSCGVSKKRPTQKCVATLWLCVTW